MRTDGGRFRHFGTIRAMTYTIPQAGDVSATPLAGPELDRLDALLTLANPDDAMLPEEFDGFSAALACCPDPVPAEEWLPLVLGRPLAAIGPMSEEDARSLLKLIVRHRNAVTAQLYEGEGYAPVLGEDEDGFSDAVDWANGFLRGMAMRPDVWDALEEDDALAETLDPLYEIAGVDDDEPDDAAGTVAGVVVDEAAAQAADDEADGGAEDEAQAAPIDREARTRLIDAMLQGVMALYDYYADERLRRLGPAAPIRRAEPKVGRNDPCPCGSGRKFKQCHGR